MNTIRSSDFDGSVWTAATTQYDLESVHERNEHRDRAGMRGCGGDADSERVPGAGGELTE